MKSNRQLRSVSGGQTGVDRGALDAALDSEIPCGGWCPAGRKAEDGRIPPVYPVRELASTRYSDRTLRNVQDSDGTLIIHFGEIEGGTDQTKRYCRIENKPCQLVDGSLMSPAQAAQLIAAFTQRNAIRSLNVAGPRASKVPQAHDYAREALSLFFNS